MLVLHRPTQIMYHFDSHNQGNLSDARRFWSRIKDKIGSIILAEAPSPQQNNSSDCGVFVIEMSRVIGENFEPDKSMEDLSKSIKSLKASVVAEARNKWIAVIDEMKK